MKIKQYFIIAIVLLFLLFISYFCVTIHNYNNLKKEYNSSVELIKAYDIENSELKEHSNLFRLTIEQLECSKDSLIQKMDSVRNVLKIKDKNLKQLQYQLIKSSKKDTIVLTDTIFKDVSLDIDTTIQDKWYKLDLGLKYPSTITVSPEFNNEQFIVVNTKKEYVKPPHKCFFVRWFQKKHTVVEVEVINENPYTEIKKQKFIEIIK